MQIDLVTQAKITAIISVIIVVMLKTYMAYKLKQIKDKIEGKEMRKFAPMYAITAIFGAFTAVSIFLPTVATTDVIDIFLGAWQYALSYTLQFDFIVGFVPAKKE